MINGKGPVREAESSASQSVRQQYQLVVNGRNTNPSTGPNLAGLANLASSLPGLSGLAGLSLPHGANLASLLASGKLLKLFSALRLSELPFLSLPASVDPPHF